MLLRDGLRRDEGIQPLPGESRAERAVGLGESSGSDQGGDVGDLIRGECAGLLTTLDLGCQLGRALEARHLSGLGPANADWHAGADEARNLGRLIAANGVGGHELIETLRH